MTRSKLMLAIVVAFAVTSIAGPAEAVKIQVPDKDDMFLKINFLVQPQIQLIHDPLLDDPALMTDFYLRRTRILLHGQVSKWVSFFFETDQSNWGRKGDWTTSEFIVQDAFVDFDIAPEFKIAVGMILTPFVRHFRQSAVSLNTLDYHAALAKYPAGSNKVWRDMGVEFRGIVAKKLDYRLAITNGVPFAAVQGAAPAGGGAAPVTYTNKSDMPRFTARLAYNLFDTDGGFFYSGTTLGKKRILAIGAAVDLQPGAFADDNTYMAVGGDVFFDIPAGGSNRMSGQVDFVYYGDADGKNANAGMGLLFDFGYAIGDWQPLVAVDWFQPKDADLKGSLLGLHLGLNYWLHGHNANIKLDVGLVKAPTRDFGDANIETTIQTQLFF